MRSSCRIFQKPMAMIMPRACSRCMILKIGLHVKTLSFTRLIFTKYCQFGGDWESENFDPKFSASSAAVGTLMGLEEEHAINQAEPVENTEFYDMMKTLQALTADMQEDFWKNLTPPEKEQFTWVLSVWGPNMLDQTQLTISTYV